MKVYLLMLPIHLCYFVVVVILIDQILLLPNILPLNVYFDYNFLGDKTNTLNVKYYYFYACYTPTKWIKNYVTFLFPVLWHKKQNSIVVLKSMKFFL